MATTSTDSIVTRRYVGLLQKLTEGSVVAPKYSGRPLELFGRQYYERVILKNNGELKLGYIVTIVLSSAYCFDVLCLDGTVYKAMPGDLEP